MLGGRIAEGSVTGPTYYIIQLRPSRTTSLSARSELARQTVIHLGSLEQMGPPVISNGSGSRYSDGACELCPCRVLGAAVVRQQCTPTFKGNRGWVDDGNRGYSTVVKIDHRRRVICDRSMDWTLAPSPRARSVAAAAADGDTRCGSARQARTGPTGTPTTW
jgi:hypothetical protein